MAPPSTSHQEFGLLAVGETGRRRQACVVEQISERDIDIFERHGFIWGGRWYHFDTMRFEYRPELLL